MKKKYDFKKWFEIKPGEDGKTRFIIRRGIHYDCSQSSMIQQLRVAASAHSVRLSIVDMDNYIVVTKQAHAVNVPPRLSFGDPDETLRSAERNA